MAAGLLEDDAEAHVRGVCFKTGPPERIGVELEWLVYDRSDPHIAMTADRLDAALAPVEMPGGMPRGSAVTREPGGQVELSSPPAGSLAGCVEAMAADVAALRRAVGREGLVLTGRGLDPYRDPPRILDQPRYAAMERFFDRDGPWGRTMMRRTASLQVNLDAGEDTHGITGYRRRWELAHRLGPVLVAAFANSPLRDGAPTGWVSTRQATWAAMDPSRTRAPAHGADPREDFARYALDARVLCVREADGGTIGGAGWTAPYGLTFRAWLRGEAPALRRPTKADLDYHLTTLFPPVRPRGWLELRMTDAQDGDAWVVPTALAATLLDDPAAADAAFAATDPLCPDGRVLPAGDVWRRAALAGPADPAVGRAVRDCFAAAESALARSDAPAALRAAVADFAERYAERGRCPAHDQLDALARV